MKAINSELLKFFFIFFKEVKIKKKNREIQTQNY